MDEHDIEKLLEVVPEESTNEELLELKQEHIDEEAKEKEMTGKKRRNPKKIHSKEVSRSFCQPQQTP